MAKQDCPFPDGLREVAMSDWPDNKELGQLKSLGVSMASTMSDTTGNGVRLSPVYDNLRRVIS